jgi:hypothetical protein
MIVVLLMLFVRSGGVFRQRLCRGRGHLFEAFVGFLPWLSWRLLFTPLEHLCGFNRRKTDPRPQQVTLQFIQQVILHIS